MARIAADITELIGRTPLVRLNRMAAGLPATVLVKLESQNPLSSVKDRIGLAMIEAAEKAGKITPGKTVLIEPTSGNTGIAPGLRRRREGLPADSDHAGDDEPGAARAAAGVWRGTGADARAERHEGRHRQGQRDSGQDAERLSSCSSSTTRPTPPFTWPPPGPEIWDDTDGKVDILISGVGTGGTITGVATYIKERKPEFKAIAVEPTDSPVLSGGKPGPHKIQGIGAGFVPSMLNTKLIDEVVQVIERRGHYDSAAAAAGGRAVCGHLLRRGGACGAEGGGAAGECRAS